MNGFPPIASFDVDEPALVQLGQRLAFYLRKGDAVALRGPLGAGKSTLARAIVRACLRDSSADVPSPTFSLVQAYEAPGLLITHADLYRLTQPSQAAELGLEEANAQGAVLVEWPERAPGLLPPGHLDIELGDGRGGEMRHVTVSCADPSWCERFKRLALLHAAMIEAGFGEARLTPMQGDASSRRYGRLVGDDGRRAVLMDAPRRPDGPPIRDGRPYSQLAHLAEDVRAFVAVGLELNRRGFSAPGIYAADFENGILVIEDLGDDVYGELIAQGEIQAPLWQGAVDVLVAIAGQPLNATLPLPDCSTYQLPPYDAQAMGIEIELLPDWYVPFMTGMAMTQERKACFLRAWQPIIDRLTRLPPTLVQRDFHSPNLLRLVDRVGVQGVGLIDFQDALAGPEGYDLVSLLQDARLDVPAGLEAELYGHYVRKRAANDPNFDDTQFAFAYAALGLQRATKILGIFARLALRDGKPQYLAHMPRMRDYVRRGFARAGADPAFAALRTWYADAGVITLEASQDAAHG